MKQLLIISAMMGILGVNDGCKAKKSATTNSNSGSNANCSLRIDFYSIGTGTDYTHIEKLTNYLESKKIPFETKPWGREGEVVYCLKFSDRKPQEIKAIKNEVKKMLATSQNTRIEEDTPLNK